MYYVLYIILFINISSSTQCCFWMQSSKVCGLSEGELLGTLDSEEIGKPTLKYEYKITT